MCRVVTGFRQKSPRNARHGESYEKSPARPVTRPNPSHSRPAAVIGGRVAHQNAVGERGAIGPSAMRGRVSQQRAIVQRATEDTATARGNVTDENTIGNHSTRKCPATRTIDFDV